MSKLNRDGVQIYYEVHGDGDQVDVWARTRHNGGVPDTEIELTDADRAERLTKLHGVIDLMRPAVQADGGDLVLIRADVETGVVEVQLDRRGAARQLDAHAHAQ